MSIIKNPSTYYTFNSSDFVTFTDMEKYFYENIPSEQSLKKYATREDVLTIIKEYNQYNWNHDETDYKKLTYTYTKDNNIYTPAISVGQISKSNKDQYNSILSLYSYAPEDMIHGGLEHAALDSVLRASERTNKIYSGYNIVSNDDNIVSALSYFNDGTSSGTAIFSSNEIHLSRSGSIKYNGRGGDKFAVNNAAEYLNKNKSNRLLSLMNIKNAAGSNVSGIGGVIINGSGNNPRTTFDVRHSSGSQFILSTNRTSHTGGFGTLSSDNKIYTALYVSGSKLHLGYRAGNTSEHKDITETSLYTGTTQYLRMKNNVITPYKNITNTSIDISVRNITVTTKVQGSILNATNYITASNSIRTNGYIQCGDGTDSVDSFRFGGPQKRMYSDGTNLIVMSDKILFRSDFSQHATSKRITGEFRGVLTVDDIIIK